MNHRTLASLEGGSSLRSPAPVTSSSPERKKMTVKELKEALRALPKTELKEIADYALMLSVETGQGYDRGEEMLYESLCLAIREVTNEQGMPFTAMRKGTMYPKFREVRKQIEDFISSSGVGKLSTPEKKKFFNTICRVLVERVQELDVPVGLKTVMNQAAGVGGHFDRAFPGYIASGLVRRII